jgi:hypothetical protein
MRHLGFRRFLSSFTLPKNLDLRKATRFWFQAVSAGGVLGNFCPKRKLLGSLVCQNKKDFPKEVFFVKNCPKRIKPAPVAAGT